MDYDISADKISGRMGTSALSSDAGSYCCCGWLILGKMNVIQISNASKWPGTTATRIIKKILLEVTKSVPKQKIFRKRLYLHCLLTGLGIREPEKNNTTPRGLKRRELRDLNEHQNSIIYNPLRKHVSPTALVACLHFRASAGWLTSYLHLPKAKPTLNCSATLMRPMLSWGHFHHHSGLLLVCLCRRGQPGAGKGREKQRALGQQHLRPWHRVIGFRGGEKDVDHWPHQSPERLPSVRCFPKHRCGSQE